mmetsp:Transcript_1007/g.1433  ORF Transcript_1007/g.1433 Transcript_1007/m.1433 type:complete len:521 (-) Transcript_1007:133-1695(-)|eukprot:CAMPEP_0175050014 /NCGR_PEP_ID=MMETSP0052_2-20121109/7037_1 /TAXON_ID=51329 ORGANISM="Polytomella parva, Strain SAG 63-3" /NCGR_SAMPLE_ID=MMETSP0052_2 /ASSEMBLY_ACC=CAM_ASM_000194 /LENGTH=520 /DNA_ID=CAMNT_0016314197 /DNA_START=58 /DNA_END=1620 /DNA_ORIENTATION=+
MQLQVKCGSNWGTKTITISPETSILSFKQCLEQTLGMTGVASLMTLTYGGRSLPNDVSILRHLSTLSLPSIPPLSSPTLHLAFRLPGGGGDGGSTGAESRSCYLEMYREKRVDSVDPAEQRRAKWGSCHLSGEPLSPPCVVDELGNLYNKEALLSSLINKTLPSSLSAYISGLKCVVNVKLTNSNDDRKSFSSSSKFSSSIPGGLNPTKSKTVIRNGSESCPFSCPLTSLPMNGMYRFVVLVPQNKSAISGTTSSTAANSSTGSLGEEGLAVSEKAMREFPEAVKELLGGPWDEQNVIQINPVEEALEAARAKVTLRLDAAAAAKRERLAAKKRKLAGNVEGDDVDEKKRRLEQEYERQDGKVGTSSGDIKGSSINLDKKLSRNTNTSSNNKSNSNSHVSNGENSNNTSTKLLSKVFSVTAKSGLDPPPVGSFLAAAKRSAAAAAATATSTSTNVLSTAPEGTKKALKKEKDERDDLVVPEGATPAVFRSLFSSGKKGEEVKETFCTRAMSVTARGMGGV